MDFLDYLGLDFIEKHIDAIDLVFLSGKEEMLADLQALSTSKHTLLVPTLGAQGSLAFYENKMYKQEALEVETIVDSTGCGDAFQAAFCLEWIGSKDIQNSLYAGALAAQKVLGYMGGVNTDF
ncbi:PfkB family carbohydrate kinase [Aureicoccus marinus]|uniref:PfkB family carbohydrate kinase n=1 Tax=Aureicoccus marinus TaxID=754435 RepID=UPI001FE34C49|nr:PfkB family carbohydrate kinase [Aureicoccus marinus]